MSEDAVGEYARMIDDFCRIACCSRDQAKQYLKRANWDFAQSIGMKLEVDTEAAGRKKDRCVRCGQTATTDTLCQYHPEAAVYEGGVFSHWPCCESQDECAVGCQTGRHRLTDCTTHGHVPHTHTHTHSHGHSHSHSHSHNHHSHGHHK